MDDGRNPVLVAVLHHQLLPVGTDEEVNPFEGITNLGQCREFLRSGRIDVVLHGHKHQGAVGLDPVEPASLRAGLPPAARRCVVVSSVGTVSRGVAGGNEIGRILEIEAVDRAVRNVVVRSLPAVHPGAGYVDRQHPVEASFCVDRYTDSVPGDAVVVIEGTDIDHVYEQILAHFEGPSAPAERRNLVCRVHEGASARRPPRGLPAVPGVADVSDWYAELVDWWQKADPGMDSRGFNHGERLHTGARERSQIDDVVRTLKDSTTTTRGVALVLDAGRDKLSGDQEIPSFCLVQFRLNTQQRLDLLGYFRKQQMRLWWPVNAGELALLQEQVADRLRDSGRPVEPGEIVTFASTAVWATGTPRVMVPRIDRQAQEHPRLVWAAALRLLDGDVGEDEQAFWHELFGDWLPTGEMEPDGVPVGVRGVGMLADVCAELARHHGSDAASRLGSALASLAHENENYLDGQSAPRQDPSERRMQYLRWTAEVRRRMEDVVERTRELRRERNSASGGGAGRR